MASRHPLLKPAIGYALLDVVAVGAGMGVPIFAILLGFPVGWMTPAVLAPTECDLRHMLRRCVAVAVLFAALTFAMMVVIWGPPIAMLFDPDTDLSNFGVPMILFEPRASFIGWMVLMIVISPALQALAGVFASTVRLAWFPSSPMSAAGRPPAAV